MSIFVALLLGAVQGITEFIPVSSSGHLVLFGELVDLSDTFVFDVLLNIGTLAALIFYTRRKLWGLVKELFAGDSTLLGKVALATVPGVSLGLVFNDFFSGLNDNVTLVAVMLVVVGVLMLLVRQCNKPLKKLDQITWADALFIGCAQAIALVPGTSRSGITILAGLGVGLSRRLAAEWSFIMAIPIIAGATLKTLLSSEGIEFVSNNFIAVFVGNIASFIVGLIAIQFLMNFLSKHDLKLFGKYRIALSALLFILIFANIL